MKPPDDEAGAERNSLSGLLDEVETAHGRRRVYRLAVIFDEDEEFMEGLKLSPEQELELNEDLTAADQQKVLEDLLDAPFQEKRKLRRKTRFSDGSYAVFYSALELETAELERAYWFRKDFLGSPESARSAFFQRFSCSFQGEEKDLRVKKSVWPELIDEDYAFCNAIGRQAHEIGLDGLVAPSARQRNGSTAPVFSRMSISRAHPEGLVKMTMLPESERVKIEEL